MMINMKRTWLVSAACILAVGFLFSCGKNKVDREKEIFQAEKYRDLGELLFKEGKYTPALKEFLKVSMTLSKIAMAKIGFEGNIFLEIFAKEIAQDILSSWALRKFSIKL